MSTEPTQLHKVFLGQPRIDWTIDLRGDAVAAPLFLKFLRLKRALDGPGEMTATLIDPGIPLGRARYPGRKKGSNPEMLAWATDLAAIQSRTGIPIHIPNRDFAEEEIETIYKLRWILKDPVVPQSWSGGTATYLCNAQEAKEELDLLTSTPGMRLRIVQAEEIELFGSVIPLGRVETVLHHPVLANEAELRRQAAALQNGEAEFVAQFVPESSNDAVARYLDWGALPQREEDAIVAREDLESNTNNGVDTQNDVPT